MSIQLTSANCISSDSSIKNVITSSSNTSLKSTQCWHPGTKYLTTTNLFFSTNFLNVKSSNVTVPILSVGILLSSRMESEERKRGGNMNHTYQFFSQISLHPGEDSGVHIVLHRAVRVVELYGGVGVHSLLQAEQGIVNTVDFTNRQINSRQSLPLHWLPQLVPLWRHLLAVAAPGGVELHKGVALPEQSEWCCLVFYYTVTMSCLIIVSKFLSVIVITGSRSISSVLMENDFWVSVLVTSSSAKTIKSWQNNRNFPNIFMIKLDTDIFPLPPDGRLADVLTA